MPGVCVVCDGCGAELSVTDTKFGGQARNVAHRAGWLVPKVPPGDLTDPNAPDYCPKCTKDRHENR